MRIQLLVLFSLVLVVLLAGCAKKEETTEIKYKNDIITIEKFNIDNLSPYSGGTTTLSFDVVNNGDRLVQYLEVNFFDIPGFTPVLDCGIVDGNKEKKVDNLCVYKDLDSLDSRTITLKLTAPQVNYPTEYKISYSITYVYDGAREALIPVIDGITKKQPSGQFRQSEATVGPVQADIQPKLEREVKVGDKTIREYWAIAGNTFETNFKFSHVGTVTGQRKEINITPTHIRMKIDGLNAVAPCEFCKKDDEACKELSKKSWLYGNAFSPPYLYFYFDMKNRVTDQSVTSSNKEFVTSSNKELAEMQQDGSYTNKYPYYSNRDTVVPKDTLICVFSPVDTGQPESTASIAVIFAYKYEFIRSESFVIQPIR